MISIGEIYADIQDILSLISPEELPETCSYLSSLQGENSPEGSTPYVIANTVLDLDKPGRLPGYVIAFIAKMFELEIVTGNADAMNDLGAQYYDGSRGFEQSFEKAVRYYSMAAENGSRQAQENLGYCYYYGRNGKPDYEKAFHYFALGAFDGHLVSLYKIGDMYLHGLYVPKNEREAFYIFMRCIETMTDEAADRVAGPVYLRLGRMFLEGTGTVRNYKNALICFQKAETFLYDMVMDGDTMYRKSLDAAIKGQEKTREKILEQLPDDTWKYDD